MLTYFRLLTQMPYRCADFGKKLWSVDVVGVEDLTLPVWAVCEEEALRLAKEAYPEVRKDIGRHTDPSPETVTFKAMLMPAEDALSQAEELPWVDDDNWGEEVPVGELYRRQVAVAAEGDEARIAHRRDREAAGVGANDAELAYEFGVHPLYHVTNHFLYGLCGCGDDGEWAAELLERMSPMYITDCVAALRSWRGNETVEEVHIRFCAQGYSVFFDIPYEETCKEGPLAAEFVKDILPEIRGWHEMQKLEKT